MFPRNQKPDLRILTNETVARRLNTAHVADSQRSLATRCQRQARAQIAKGNGLDLIEAMRDPAMDAPVIDDLHTRAICDEIGERLRVLLKPPVLDEKAELDDKLDQLLSQQSEDASMS